MIMTTVSPHSPRSNDRRSRLPRTGRVVLALMLAIAFSYQLGTPLLADDEVTLERIMAHPDWIGNAPESPYWAEDGATIFFEQKRQGEELRDLKRINLASGEISDVADEDLSKISVPGGDWSRDRRHKVYSRNGDIFLADVQTRTVRQLTRTAESENRAFFMAGDNAVAFNRGRQIFVRDLTTGLEYQPAVLSAEDDPEAKPEPTDYLTLQQERLFDIIKLRKEREEAEEQREREQRKVDPTRAPSPFYLGAKVEIAGTSLSPSGRWMLVTVSETGRQKGRNDKMPHFVTASGFVEVDDVRVKVGTDAPTDHRLLLLDLEKHDIHSIDLDGLPGITDDPLADLKAAAKARKEAEAAEKAKEDKDAEANDESGKTGDDQDEGESEKASEVEAEKESPEPEQRPVGIFGMQWNDAGDRVAMMIFSSDNKDRWIATLDLETQELVSQHRLHDPAWINWDFNEAGWLEDGETLWYLSEESNFSRLYLKNVAESSSNARQLTGTESEDADYLVGSVVLSPDGDYLYFRANRTHPGEWEVHRVAVTGGPVEQITDLDGDTEFSLSADGAQLLLLHSKSLRPDEIYVQEARPGATARRMTETVSEEFTSIAWSEPEFVEVPSSHVEKPIFSKLYLPDGHDSAAEAAHPAVIFIHGAGYTQNAHKGWPYYFREQMFHTLLNRHGYVVLDMDFRASAGYGRDWRTAIYRQMGTPEVQDLVDGVAWMAEHHGVDPERVGIYGGSYGGFLTFMGLFTEPGTFAAGAAIRPVTDWAHYNHGYTSNILNTPEVDPEAFERSSPIEFAADLEDPLLMIHGMLDDNVFALDTIRLAQRLIELEKEDWEMALYPIEPHAFQEPSSWLDAYRRIFKLFENHVRNVD